MSASAIIIEAELQEIQERLRLAIEAADLGTFSCRPPRSEIDWNSKCKEHFWLSADALVDFDLFYAIIHADDRAMVRTAVEAAIDRGVPYDVEFRTVSPQGEHRWIRGIGRTFPGGPGEPLRFEGVTLDVTKTKENELKLRFLDRLSRLQRDLRDARSVMKSVTEEVGRYLGVNRCAYANVDADENGFTIPDDYTDGCPTCAGRYELNAFGARAAADMRSGNTLILENIPLQLAADDGGRTFGAIDLAAIVCVPLKKDGRLAAMMAVHQTTPRRWKAFEVQVVEEATRRAWETIERVEAEALIARTREQLLAAERAARVEAERLGRIKDEFVATLSHELRTPLNAILGWSQILRSELAGTHMAEEAEVIARNARAQARLIDDLLDVNSIITGKIRLSIEEVDLALIVEEAIKALEPAITAKGLALAKSIGSSVRLRADASRLQQVLWNLLSNAIKFTPRGGSISVAVTRGDREIEVRVSDTGEGIAPEFIPRVFERFQQADSSRTRSHGGLGLGLAIVRHLTELHGGTVSAASEGPGRGATFSVRIPCGRGGSDVVVGRSRSVHERILAPRLEAALSGLRVLVVDDEPDSRQLAAHVLRDWGAVVETAASAADCLRRLGEFRPRVLVCDIGMPEEDGYALLRRIRKLPGGAGGDVRACALTAYARPEDRAASVSAGYRRHVAKPVDFIELLTAVGELALDEP